jgi:predicted RNA-binding Zn-ribbon protein involved in translation (DUF1610 family)
VPRLPPISREMTPSRCPDCGGPLLAEEGGRWLCPDCGGAAEARHTLVDETVAGTADGLASASGGGRRRCPACGQAMAVARVATDPAGGTDVDLCTTCDLVWLDAGDRDRLPLRLSPDRAEALESAATDAGAALVEPPARCPDCGAPWEVVDSNRCRWCGATLLVAAPRQVS